MKNHFIVAAIVAVSIIIAFNMGLKKGNTNCVNSADVLHTDTMPLSIYLSTNDIAHVYFADKKIYFENGGERTGYWELDLAIELLSDPSSASLTRRLESDARRPRRHRHS